jgi:glycosyltransferase involved in cell wall biosynthesis
MPSITVLTPTFNPNLIYLKKMLASLKKQTFKDFDLLIVDESTSVDLNFIKNLKLGFKVKILKPRKKLGIGGSLAFGTSQIKSQFVARIDADDIASDNRLKNQYDFLMGHPDISLVGSSVFKIDSFGKITGFRNYPISHCDILSQLNVWNPLCHPSLMIRTIFFKRYGNYANLRNNEDYELWLRASLQGAKFHNLKEKLTYYRIQSEDGLSSPRNWGSALNLKIKYFNFHYFFSSFIGILLTLLMIIVPSRLKRLIYNRYNKLR